MRALKALLRGLDMQLITANTLPDSKSTAHQEVRTQVTPVRIVTTSWDDGDPSDLRVAELLDLCGLSGTFYIPIKGHHKLGPLNNTDLRSLAAQGFEIGGHGVCHPNLPSCEPETLFHEVSDCKKALEDILGGPVRLFAYPRGRYNDKVISALKKARYLGARTTRMLARDLKFDAFKMPTSVQVYPHGNIDYIKNLSRAFYFGEAWQYVARPSVMSSWVTLAKALFDSVIEKGGIWHLYGHSWEINELGLWDSLREVLFYVARRDGAQYLPNRDVLSFLSGKSSQGSCKAATPRTYEDPARS